MRYFKEYFETQINTLYGTLSSGLTPIIPQGYKLNVIEEMSYGTQDESEKNTITIVLKFLVGTVLTNSNVYPVQFLVFSEPNSVDVSRTLMDEFAKQYSMTTFSHNITTFYKQMYSTTTIMSNFNRTPDGMRSVLFLSGTLVETENVIDVSAIKIKRGSQTLFTTVKFTSFALSYANTPDTHKISGAEISESKKKFASQALSFTTHNQDTVFLQDVFNIVKGTLSGNTVFTIELHKHNGLIASFNMILLDYSLSSTPGELPMITLRFIK